MHTSIVDPKPRGQKKGSQQSKPGNSAAAALHTKTSTKTVQCRKKKKTSSVQRALQVQSAVPGFPGHRNQSVALELGACADWLENAEASARATDQITRAKKKKKFYLIRLLHIV